MRHLCARELHNSLVLRCTLDVRSGVKTDHLFTARMSPPARCGHSPQRDRYLHPAPAPARCRALGQPVPVLSQLSHRISTAKFMYAMDRRPLDLEHRSDVDRTHAYPAGHTDPAGQAPKVLSARRGVVKSVSPRPRGGADGCARQPPDSAQEPARRRAEPR
jgi:hypothetical protein